MTQSDQVGLSPGVPPRGSDPGLGDIIGNPPEPRTRRWEPYGFVGESMIEDALVADWKGTRYVCPRRPQLRMLEGVLALYNSFDTVGRTVIIPEEVARQADRELRKLKASEPDIRSPDSHFRLACTGALVRGLCTWRAGVPGRHRGTRTNSVPDQVASGQGSSGDNQGSPGRRPECQLR